MQKGAERFERDCVCQRQIGELTGDIKNHHLKGRDRGQSGDTATGSFSTELGLQRRKSCADGESLLCHLRRNEIPRQKR